MFSIETKSNSEAMMVCGCNRTVLMPFEQLVKLSQIEQIIF